MWILSPEKVIDAFIHAHDLPATAWGSQRALTLSGITFSVKEGVDALRRIAGDTVAKRVVFKRDERLNTMVRSFPGRFRTDRALAMGFVPDTDIESIIRAYIKDEGIAI
jgi:hypothetical protein